MKNLKKLIVVIFSLILILNCSSVAFAADSDDNENLFLELTEDNSSAGGNNTSNNTNNNTNENSIFQPMDDDENETRNNTSNNNTNNSNTNTNISINSSSQNTNTNRNVSGNTNRNTSNSNSLADTGIANFGGIVALIVVVCVISTIYSYKKVNDYKNL